MGPRVSTMLPCVIMVCAGCATHADRLREVRTAYFQGDTKLAATKLDSALKSSSRDADVLKLDRALMLLCEGRAREAEQLLREVRDRFEHLEQKDLAEGVLSMLTDDQRLAYAGEDYEKVMIRVFLALANLMGDGQDASAYSLQVAAKQQQIVQAGKGPDGQNRKQGYKQVAIGAYLHAALREETHANYDDAARALEQVCHWAPEFHAGKKELERVRGGRHSNPGYGVLYVVTLVGRGPYKEERMELPTTVGLLVADRILSATAKHTVPPNVAPVKVPRVVRPMNEVQSVGVVVDDQMRGQTETITDVGRMAAEQCEADLPTVIGRAIARRVVKKAAVYGVKEIAGTDKGGLASIALDVAGIVWEATESADTRCWGLLPDKVQVLRLELPAGTHQLALQPLSAHGHPQGSAQPTAVHIDDGRNTYLLANFPTGRLAGQVVCSGQLKASLRDPPPSVPSDNR